MAGNLTTAIASIFSGSAVTADPYYEYTTLLLPGNGTNGAQNNTFLDDSTNNFTITRNGNTTQGTFSPFSQTGWGNYFSGSSQYLTVPNETFVLGSNDFVVESFIYVTDITSSPRSIAVGQTDAATAGGSSWDFTINQTTGTLKGALWIGGSATVITSTNAVPLNQWVHVAFVRTGGTGSLFINGTKDGTNTGLGTSSVQTGSTTYAPSIGRNGPGSFFSGYISNCRIVIGAGAASVYNATSSSITVPTSPLTAVTNTVVLTCQSNRFVDNSSSPVTITPSGNTSVVAFSPFNPSASWSAATYGGSGYFDGSGDYLSIADNDAFALGSNDWTIECWVYISTLSAQGFIAQIASNGADTSMGFGLGINASGYPYVASYINGAYTAATASTAIVTNQWNHIAGSRASGTMGVFLNGTRLASTTVSGSSVNSTNIVTVGSSNSGASALTTGYISGARIVNGTAVYSGTTYTVPTAPPTAITNTQLLLNFTNAGIYDATSKNVLETVGSVQISTAQSKWGGSSIYSPGVYLRSPASNLYNFGSGDFTVEMYIYLISFSSYLGTFCGVWGPNASGNPYREWIIRQGNTPSPSKLRYVSSNGSTSIALETSSSVLVTNQWMHIAASRASGTLRLYVDGIQVLSGADSNNMPITGIPLTVGAISDGTITSNHYIQDLRITKGYARYTSNFTPPTAPLSTL